MTTQRDMLRDDASLRITRFLPDDAWLPRRALTKKAGIGAGGLHCRADALVMQGMATLPNVTSASDKRRHAKARAPEGIAAKADPKPRDMSRKPSPHRALNAGIQAVSAHPSQGELADLHAPSEARRACLDETGRRVLDAWRVDVAPQVRCAHAAPTA